MSTEYNLLPSGVISAKHFVVEHLYRENCMLTGASFPFHPDQNPFVKINARPKVSHQVKDAILAVGGGGGGGG